MSDKHHYTKYHPRWFRTQMSTYWWLKRRSHLVFILREISSIFVAWFVVYILLLMRAVSEGDASYQRFLSWSESGGILLLNVISLFFVVFHAVTWFNLAPKAMVVHLRGKRVPGVLISSSHYAAWAVASALLTWVILGG